MRILVTWGSKRGGTEGIARVVAEALSNEGLDVRLTGPREALRARDFDAAVVGGALYATRWHRDARRFVERRADDLARVPTWFFSSGPLDDSASASEIPPTKQVALLMDRVGAQGHATFGGRLEPDARGFPASAMAKKHAGDHRDMERVRAWASGIARELPSARPRPVAARAGQSFGNVLAHGAVGWAACAAVAALALGVLPRGAALAVAAFVAPIVFAFVARHYFAQRGARDALPGAAWLAGTFAALDALAWLLARPAAPAYAAWLCLSAALVLLTAWTVGFFAALSPMKREPS